MPDSSKRKRCASEPDTNLRPSTRQRRSHFHRHHDRQNNQWVKAAPNRQNERCDSRCSLHEDSRNQLPHISIHPTGQPRPSHALTEDNLIRFTQLTMPNGGGGGDDEMAAALTTRRKRKSESPSKRSADEMARLKAYKIRDLSSQHAPLPSELEDFISSLSKRDPEHGPPSARGKNILRLHEAAAKKQEDDAMDIMTRHLFLETALHGAENAHLYIEQARNHNLVRGFLPKPPDKFAMDFGLLENPRPDLCYGYMKTDFTALNLDSVKALLSEKEELIVISKAVHVSKDMHFPFLTVEMKSALGYGLTAAERQVLRDGAAIVNANHILFDLAQTPASLTQTCHFSAASGLRTACLYVHYRQHDNADPRFPTYHTKKIYECRLGNADDVEGWRTRITNIYNWAVGFRVNAIKVAIANLALRDGSTVGPGRDDVSSVEAPFESEIGSSSGRQDVQSLRGADERWGAGATSDMRPHQVFPPLRPPGETPLAPGTRGVADTASDPGYVEGSVDSGSYSEADLASKRRRV